MRDKYRPHLILEVVLLFIALAGLPAGNSWAEEESPYLKAVREFADNILKYGRDTYGPKHTPLFVDGLNIHTHEPVKWIDPDGTKWILSNLASQQTLMRTLDGLSEITGDPKYRDAAMQAIKYAFEHLRTPSGLFYWGHVTAYDALRDTVRGNKTRESIKLHYPYYELMWKVDPDATKKLIEALWCAHVMDWSNLDFNRIGITTASQEEPWNHEYKGGPTFFKSKSGGLGFFVTASSLIQAGTTLCRLSREEQPLVWSKRLAKRFVDTRHPNTGISTGLYNRLPPRPPLGDDLKEHFRDPHTRVFPYNPFEETRGIYYPENAEAHDWVSLFLVGGMLDEKGKEFTQWALEELTAWGKTGYRKKDNSFIPILTDGTKIEGYVSKKSNSYGQKGAIAKPLFANLGLFWAYTVAYRTTSDEFMWKMTHDIGLGNSFGDIGGRPEDTPELETDTTCSDVYGLLGFLELYEKTSNRSFLQMAQRIGDNIVGNQLYKGFFVPSKKHIYSRFDCFEPLALLHLVAAIKSESVSVPQVWPSCPLFVAPYRHKQEGNDRRYVYSLTESTEPPLSLQEVAAIGDVNMVSSLLEKGVGVDSWDVSLKKTALQRAAMSGHKDVVELLIAKGARIDAQEDFPGGTSLDYAAENGHKKIAELLIAKGADVNATRRGYPKGDTPLHSAARAGHKDIVELLIAKGADVNAKNNDGQTPLDIAQSRNRRDVVELLLAKGATISSIHVAAQMGDLARVKAFLEQGADVNAQDDKGITPLKYAALGGHKDVAEFLIANGADINGKDKWGYTPLYYAIWNEDKDMVKLLVDKGADVNVLPNDDGTPLEYAVWNEDVEMAKLFVARGAKLDVKDNDGWTAFRYAASGGNRELVEFFVSKGADVSGIHGAACIGDLARVKDFVQQGTDIDTKDEMDWTPLYWAASTGQEDVAEFLIAKDANVDAKAEDSSTPLHQAAQAGSVKLVKLLIAKGADVNAKAKNGNTPLHSAALGGNRAVVELLVAKGATVNVKGGRDRTPLHSAALQGHKGVVEILVKRGADVDAKDNQGRTPLWWANRIGHKEIVELLRKHGAKE